VVGIFGKRGSGKSYTLGSILESLCTAEFETTIGRCSRTRAVILFDTLNIFWTIGEPLKETDESSFSKEHAALKAWGITPIATDVAVFVPRGFSTTNTPSSYQQLSMPPNALAVEDWADLLETDLFSDRTGQLLFDVYTKVTQDGWVAAQGPHEPKSNFFIQDFLDCLRQDLEIQDYYASETIRALSQRLKAVGNLTFFSNEEFSMHSLARPGQLSVILLNRVPETLRSLLVSVLMRRILAERSEASELGKLLKFSRTLSHEEKTRIQGRIDDLIPPTIVALDEAQNVLPSEHATKATNTIIKYVREGRNHGLSFIFTTQQPSAIDVRILAQIDTIIGHKLTIAADVKRFEDNLKSQHPDLVKLGGRELNFSSWLRTLSQGQAIVSNTEESRHFVVDVRPRISPHGGQGSV
jgi:DNA helicase HerA-like ATPase